MHSDLFLEKTGDDIWKISQMNWKSCSVIRLEKMVWNIRM